MAALKRGGVALLLASFGLPGCERTRDVPATQIVVRIEAQRPVRDGLRTLRVRTNSDDNGVWGARDEEVFNASALTWPVDIVLVPRAGSEPYHQFEVVVAALDAAGERMVEARAISQFRAHEQRVLPIRLAPCGESSLGELCEGDPACLGAECKTCVGGKCMRTPITPVGSLPLFTPSDVAMSPEDDAGDAREDAGGLAGDAGVARDADALVDDAGEPSDGGTDDAQVAGDAGDSAVPDIDECMDDNVCLAETYPCVNRPGDYYCRGQFPEQSLERPPMFIALGDGTVRDRNTGLRWQTRLPGDGAPAPSGYAGCSGALTVPRDMRCTQAQAVDYCANGAPELPGTGWRLPTLHELLSLVDDTRSNRAIDGTFFPDGTPTPRYAYWTASPDVGEPGYAWFVDFTEGAVNTTNTAAGFFVRCVKDEP